jgi:exodeoxyribonuclease VII small subunit
MSSRTFEEQMEEFEQIIISMENGDVSLDESIKLFQKGIKLSGLLYKRLNDVEKKVITLVEGENGKYEERIFEMTEE